jgi:hypothetical protein
MITTEVGVPVWFVSCENMTVDYVREIRKVWGISSDVIELDFREDTHLIPPNPRSQWKCVDGTLSAEIVVPDASDYDTIVYHEGAHVYLLTLNYPLIKIIEKRDSPFHCYDWVNEFYAIGLEILKRNTAKYERVQEIKRQMIDIEKKPPYDRIAYAAIYERIVAELGEPTEEIRAMSDSKLRGDPDYLDWFDWILRFLQNVPPLPNRRLDDKESERTFDLAKMMMSSLFRGMCNVERVYCEG